MLTKNNVLHWLQTHAVATIATLSASHIPQMAAVYTYVDKNYHCYFVTKEATRKCANLARDKTISLTWFDEQSLTTCEMTGEAYVVQAGDEVAVAVTHLQEIIVGQKDQYWIPPVGQIPGEQYVIFRVVPDHVTYVDYSLATTDDPRPRRLTLDL